MNVDMTSEPDEIVQSESYDNSTPVDVRVCAPVQTREVPASGHPGYKTEQGVSATVGVRLLALEPRRKYATLIAQDQDIWISSSQAGAQAGASGAMRVPAVVPYVIGHMHEVWACAVTGTTGIGVESVYWSE